jgi:hypothetical protein
MKNKQSHFGRKNKRASKKANYFRLLLKKQSQSKEWLIVTVEREAADL